MITLDSGSDQKHWLFWDGHCGFCRECADWARRHDRDGRFTIVPYQQAPFPPMTAELRENCRVAIQVLTTSGDILSAGKAVGFILHEVGFRRLGRILSWRWLAPVVEWGYRRVANNRNWLGRLVFGRTCRDEPSRG